MTPSASGDRTRQAFDAAAADFTALGRYLWDPIGAATAEAGRLRPGQRVLDACCGDGASAIPAARSVGPDGLVDAVDVSGPMIAALGRRTADLPQLHAHQADITTWERSGYDVVQCALGIFFLPDMTTDTERLIRLAGPGGRVVLTIWRGQAMAAAGRHLGRAIATATGTEPPAERKPHLVDTINQPDTFAAWLAERGLPDAEVQVDHRQLTMEPDLAWLVITGSGFRGALNGLPAETVDAVRELYLSSLHAEGIHSLDATTVIGSGIVPA